MKFTRNAGLAVAAATLGAIVAAIPFLSVELENVAVSVVAPETVPLLSKNPQLEPLPETFLA